MARRNILIVTYWFPPANLVGSLRLLSFAKYWARSGHSVRVLTAGKTLFDGPQTLEPAPGELDGVEVVETPYRPFRGRLAAPSGGPLTPGEASDHPRDARARMLPAVRRATRLLRKGIGYAADFRDLWVGPAVREARRLHARLPVEIVVSSFGPRASHLAGAAIRKETGAFWCADYRDLWNGGPFEAPWPLSEVDRLLERRALRGAGLVSTVSEPLAGRLSERLRKPVVVVENGFEPCEGPGGASPIPVFPADGKVRLVYTGSIYPGFRDPSPLFEAIACLRDAGVPVGRRLEVVFYGPASRPVADAAARFALEDVVRAAGEVPRAEALSAQRAADALLFLDWNDPSEPGNLTGKLFEYLNAGRPILSVGGLPTHAAGRLIAEARAGIVAGNSPPAIRAALEKLLSGEFAAAGPDPAVLARYTRERLAGRLLDAILGGAMGYNPVR
jgi:hypothetical protein